MDSSGSGSKDPELKKHLEAAKRAASALFSGTSLKVSNVCFSLKRPRNTFTANEFLHFLVLYAGSVHYCLCTNWCMYNGPSRN